MTARSYLFVPGDRPDMLAKAAGRGADALILDLEDAVAPSAKVGARTTIAEHLDDLTGAGPELWLRVNNHPDLFEGDLAVAAHRGIHGVFLPKIHDPLEVERALTVLAGHGRDDVALDPMIETGKAVLAAARIAAMPNVAHMTLGLADMGADLGIAGAPDDPVWAPIRLQMVVVSAAVGIEPPVAPVSPNFRDLDAYRSGSVSWERQGFMGRQAIHPAQVPVLNEVFSPSEEEVAEARRVLALFDAALAEGKGAITDEDGTMLDEAFVRRARWTVQRAGQR